jgi:hypothetical protein
MLTPIRQQGLDRTRRSLRCAALLGAAAYAEARAAEISGIFPAPPRSSSNA